jgi:chromate transporter
MSASHAFRPAHPSFGSALRFWTKLGFISFGGPTGQIAIMHEELVERRRWISENRFLHALNYCMVLPGPEAQQLAIYCGWLLHGVPGGIVAGMLFVLPSFVLLVALSWIYAVHGSVPAVQAALLGIKPVVIAIIAAALWRIARKSLRSIPLVLLAAAACAAIVLGHVPFPIVVVASGLLGWVGARIAPAAFPSSSGHASGGKTEAVIDAAAVAPRHVESSARRAARIAALAAILWAAPVAALRWLQPQVPVLYDEALFFTKAAWVTIGGAYAVLPYIAFAGITKYHWLTASQMIDGLALGETTPGPLIMVTTFVGFLGGWNHPGAWSPATTAVAAASVTTYMTFLFCFFFIFLGAPYIERFRTNAGLSAALAGVGAAVVGVIANLAVFLGAHVFVPDGRIDLFAILLAAASFWMLRYRKWSIHWVVLLGAAAGIAWTFLRSSFVR